MILNNDHLYMQRALDLAILGLGKVAPNPLVGCVIVKKNKIISEGWHQKYGGPHAEVNAINNIKTQKDLSGCTVYVNLEPCAHQGKTPPCADLIAKLKPERVVIGNFDTHHLVHGRGIERLQKAGIPTYTNLLAKRGRLLNKRFFTGVEKNRPYIILKWAASADGFIAPYNGHLERISNSQSHKWVHYWRTLEEAILVGTNTAINDNPQLDSRLWSGKNPLRIVIDRKLRLPSDLNLFDRKIPTLCYNTIRNQKNDNLEYIKITGEEKHFLEELLKDLNQRNVQSLIVEGGYQILTAFINNNLWDEARIFTAPALLNKGIPQPGLLHGMTWEAFNAGTDRLRIYYNPHQSLIKN